MTSDPFVSSSRGRQNPGTAHEPGRGDNVMSQIQSLRSDLIWTRWPQGCCFGRNNWLYYQEGQLTEKIDDQFFLNSCPNMSPTAFVSMMPMPLTVSYKIHQQQLLGRLPGTSQKDLPAYHKGGSSVNACCEIPITRSLAAEISNTIADGFESKGKDFAGSH